MAGARRQPQTSIYETTLENPELEEALKTRASMKDRESTAKHNTKVADERAKGLIATLDLGVGAAVRVGDFVIEIKPTKPRDVAFKTDAGTRVWIKPIKE